MTVTSALASEDRHTAKKTSGSWSQPAQGEQPLPPHFCSWEWGSTIIHGCELWQSLLCLPYRPKPSPEHIQPSPASRGAPGPFPAPEIMHPRL